MLCQLRLSGFLQRPFDPYVQLTYLFVSSWFHIRTRCVHNTPAQTNNSTLINGDTQKTYRPTAERKHAFYLGIAVSPRKAEMILWNQLGARLNFGATYCEDARSLFT